MPAVLLMLMLSDREEISRGLAEGLLFTEIGAGHAPQSDAPEAILRLVRQASRRAHATA
jgi:hypothetical protein